MIMLLRSIAIVLLSVMVVAGCSDDVVIPEPNLVLESGMVNAKLSAVRKPGDVVMKGGTVSALTVTRVRVLVDRVLLHANDDSSSTDDKLVKSGPFIFVADSTGGRVIASVNVTPGSYRKLKFEFHPFDSSIAPDYAMDPTFKDFVTNDRYSVIIEGNLVRNGQPARFTYKSDVNQNLSLDFMPELVIGSNGASTVVLKFDAASVFRSGQDILDPDDKQNESEIDNGIKQSLRMN